MLYHHARTKIVYGSGWKSRNQIYLIDFIDCMSEGKKLRKVSVYTVRKIIAEWM